MKREKFHAIRCNKSKYAYVYFWGPWIIILCFFCKPLLQSAGGHERYKSAKATRKVTKDIRATYIFQKGGKHWVSWKSSRVKERWISSEMPNNLCASIWYISFCGILLYWGLVREFEIEIKRCSVIIHSCLQTKHFALQNVQFLIPGLLFRHSIIPGRDNTSSWGFTNLSGWWTLSKVSILWIFLHWSVV